jgi:hypothetical protein
MAANSKSFHSAGFHRVKSRIRSAACLILLSLLPASAQDGGQPKVSMKIDLVAWGDDIHGLTLKKGDSNGDITALGFRYSSPVSYSGPLVMEIHQTGSGPQKGAEELSQDDLDHLLMPLKPKEAPLQPGEEVRNPFAVELEKRRKENPSLVALAQLPGPSCKRATVLLAPAANGTFVAYVIDDDPSKLPPGKLRVHNLSPFEVALACNGGAAKPLKTRESHLFNAADGQIIYELAYKQDERWIVQENNILAITPNDQFQMIILRSRNQFFLSSDGSSGGFLQIVNLRRQPNRN